MRPEDTSPEAWRVFIELQRNMPPSEKMRHVFEYSMTLAAMAESDIRSRYPNASEEEIFVRAASRRLDRETMIKVYGWDPETNVWIRNRRSPAL